MDIKKAIADVSDKTLNQMLLVGLPVVTLALVFLSVMGAHRSQALEMRHFLSTLTARDVARVVVTPEGGFQAKPAAAATETGPRAATIVTPAAVQKVLAAYQHASSCGPGGGRFAGGWKARVDFYLRTGQVIYSTIYQNDYASLLFITSDSTAGPSSPDDCLMSQPAGRLVKHLSSHPL